MSDNTGYSLNYRHCGMLFTTKEEADNHYEETHRRKEQTRSSEGHYPYMRVLKMCYACLLALEALLWQRMPFHPAETSLKQSSSLSKECTNVVGRPSLV